jgi:hypothetical protein
MALPRAPCLTAAQQAWCLRTSSLTAAGSGRVSCGRLRWDFTVRPSVVSRTYGVRLEYSVDAGPAVYVREPDLVSLAEQRRLPHVYSQQPVELCLYLPRSGQWHRGLSLAATLVPWTYLWLDYFEEWLVSNEWAGGGEHPAPAASRERRRGRWKNTCRRA